MIKTLLNCMIPFLWVALFFNFPAFAESGKANKDSIPRIDSVIHSFMEKHAIPGISIAITRDEEPVYVKGYGYADTAGKIETRPDHLFRVASISKPITGIAIMKLLEQERLSLDQSVFGSDGILGERYGTTPYQQEIRQVTVRHLLQHTAGGWSNRGGKDPMFLDPTWSMERLISYTIDSIPLDYKPGERYMYSNFGYCLLGRVIETITGQTYEDYVRQEILLPMGITDMRIGGNTLNDRYPNEVIYYGQKSGGLYPYKYNITRMDAHGGWLASARDLMRLMTHVDGFNQQTDILDPATLELMTTVADAIDNETYAYGWRVNDEKEWWHSGSLPGTATHFRRLPNGFNWTVLSNSRVRGIFGELESLLDEVIKDESFVWPGTLPANFDEYVEKVLESFDVPGVSVAVVQNGKTLLAKGYGVKEIGRSEPVDAHTLFCIASNSKAFTGTLLAMLVEEGVIGWDDRVIDHLPWFKMADPYVTNHMTVEDLLVHRSGLGLGAGDLLQFPPTTYSAREIVERLRYVPLESSFRQRYAYDNALYIVAGELIREVTGQSWEEHVQKRIFNPLGMKASIPRISDLMNQPNIAMPHTPVDGKVRVGENFPAIRMLDASNAAGGISSNAVEMAAWMKLQLDSGRTPAGRELLRPTTMRRLWSIVTPMPLHVPGAHLAPLAQTYAGYGLGFRINDYRDQQIVWHTGGLSGAYYSKVTLVPSLGLGISVLTNQENRNAFEAISYQLLDHFMGISEEVGQDWLASFRQEDDRQKARLARIENESQQGRDIHSKPSLPLEQYAGVYRDKWYGDVIVGHKGNALTIQFAPTPAFVGKLEHWQYNTFVAKWDDRSLKSDAFMTFVIGPEGKIEEVKMKAFSPAVNFSRDFHDLELYPVEPRQ